MTLFRCHWFALALVGSLGGVACGRGTGPVGPSALATTAIPLSAEAAGAVSSPSSTPTPTGTPTPSPTATITPTPTPTPTATPTALPALFVGDPRLPLLAEPAPAPGAPCGLVDTLDFPIDPPDAAGVTFGGSDFGVFRRRYDKYHAGEDWRAPGGGSSFGKPVYAIGHGAVTYADPDGWGRDKGVVILRHVFPDGRTFLSFYGHLDPPSVDLRPGDCVTRGQVVGNIGRPRTSPHLHFEIRTHMPAEPGPGYWPEDPTLAGWLPPSLTIWRERLRAVPGVVWSVPGGGEQEGDIQAVTGSLAEGAIVALDGDDGLLGLDPTSGATRWRLEGRYAAAAVSESRLYAIDRSGTVTRLEREVAGTSPTPLWTRESEGLGTPTLLPLPGGGIVVARRDGLTGFAPDGSLRWRLPAASLPVDFATDDRRLFVSLGGLEPVLLALDTNGESWRASGGGQLALNDGRLLAYDAAGVRALDPATGAFRVLFGAASRLWDRGDVIGLADGGVLLAHSDVYDRRLIALDPDGRLRWERSLGRPGGTVDRLMRTGGELLLLTAPSPGYAGASIIAGVDPGGGRLTRLFVETSRVRRPVGPWAWSLTWALEPEGILLQSTSGQLALFDPTAARAQIEAAGAGTASGSARP